VNRPTRATRSNRPTNGITSGPTNGVTSGPTNGHVTPEHPEPASLAALIQEAESLHETICDVKSRAGRLLAALRRHRRREKLVAATLASLRELKLSEVTG
jgi:hypothetical protein